VSHWWTRVERLPEKPFAWAWFAVVGIGAFLLDVRWLTAWAVTILLPSLVAVVLMFPPMWHEPLSSDKPLGFGRQHPLSGADKFALFWFSAGLAGALLAQAVRVLHQS